MQNNFVLSLMCLTGLTPKERCPSYTPISNYQLNHIWNPTNPYAADRYNSGYYVWSKERQPPRYTDLNNVKIKIAAIEEPPYITKIYPNGSLEGVARKILDILRETLQFDYEIVTPPDKLVGLYNESVPGQWTGIMGMLRRGEANMSIQFISMLAIRTEALNFSAPFGEERWVVMMQRPKETTDGEGLVAPFRKDVWYCLLIALLVMGPLCYILVRLKCIACKSQPHLSIPYTIGGCIWFVYGALMKQGSVLKPIADSSRILFATWWIFVTILTAFYTANLTAYLTLSKIPIPYDNLERIGYGDYFVTRDGDTLEQVFRLKPTPNDTTKDKFYYRLPVQYPEFYKLRYRYGDSNARGTYSKNATEMTDLVRRKGLLLLDEQTRVERVIYRDFREMSRKQVKLALRCTFIMSRHPILRTPYGYAFSNGRIRDIFGPVLSKMAIGGLFNYWKRLDIPIRDPCSADSDFRERQLRNGDLKTTYVLCGSGYSVAFGSFLLEVIIKLILNRKMKTQLVPSDKSNISFYKGNLTVPPGAPTYFDTDKFLKNINGRNYIVMKTADGRTRLVPKSDGMQALQPVYQPPPLISFGYMS